MVLVTVDTLRADHLGVDRYPRDTSPNLDALARAGAYFPRCYSVSATTGASHASLFYSVEPPLHGVLANRQRFPLRPGLMSAFRAAGHHAAAFVSSVVLGRRSGLAEHFDHFDDAFTTVERNRAVRYERPAQATVAAVRRHLASLPRGRPFFAWVHLIDPHGPYDPPEGGDVFVADAFVPAVPLVLPLGADDWVRGAIPRYQVLAGRTEAEYYVARYDAEIRYADRALGELLQGLAALGRDAATVVAVTADHGETLADAGRGRYFSHGVIAHEEVVRVPLVLRGAPGDARLARVPRLLPVSTMDVAPTLLSLAGVAVPREFRGRDLLTAELHEDVSLPSFGAYGFEDLERDLGTEFSLRRGPWRYLVRSLDGAESLYDHRQDPAELTDVAAREPAVLAALRRELAAIRALGTARAPEVEPDPEQAEALRALGYAR